MKNSSSPSIYLKGSCRVGCLICRPAEPVSNPRVPTLLGHLRARGGLCCMACFEGTSQSRNKFRTSGLGLDLAIKRFGAGWGWENYSEI